MRIKELILPLILFYSYALSAQMNDSILSLYTIDEFTVTAVKQGRDLYAEPLSATVLSQASLELNRTKSIKEAAALSPNLYIPNYGSRITSSIYVRGLGSRIDNPVVGLNVDNIPYVNKNTFDVDISDITRVEMVRGPQSTMYGRNTMGGVINIYTLSPFAYQGLRAGAEYGNGNTYKLRASYYDKMNDKFAYSLGASYGTSSGFFTNEHTDELADWEQNLNARLKLQYRPNADLRIENTSSLDMLRQGGYPYENVETGIIAYNDTSSYSRANFSNGLSVQRSLAWGQLNSMTSYNYLNDAMRLDQDFTPQSYCTLTQATCEHYVTEDFVLKLNRKKGYQSLFGLFGMYKNQRMAAPVTFKHYGIEQLILKNMNEQLAPYYYVWNEPTFLLDSNFKNTLANLALYHESEYKYRRLKATVSLRADYEWNALQYHSSAHSSATGYDSNDQFFLQKEVQIDKKDNLGQHSLVLIPKLALWYTFDQNKHSSLYLSAGRGHKAGGFNTQMFSDILQQDVMTEFGVGQQYDVDELISYEPEYNWTYEVGTHIEDASQRFVFDVSLFYIDCYNQQLTVFPPGQTTGRLMTNAGRSRSMGGEFASHISITPAWNLVASYGYTNAKFIKYLSGNDNYKGNFVPYAPQHTLHAGSTYTLPIAKNNLVFDVNVNGVGGIYWNEQNSLSQPLYMLLNGTVQFEHPLFSIALWGKNVTNAAYNVFYFKSIGREFVQRGRGITFGTTLSVTLGDF